MTAGSTERVTTLANLDRARAALAAATSFWDIREIRDIAEAGRAYAVARGMGEEAINHATSIKLEAARKIGQILRTSKKRAGRPPGNVSVSSDTFPPTLADLGLTRNQSSDCQALAAVDEDTFTDIVQEAKAEGSISETAVVKKARSKRAKTAHAERANKQKIVEAAPPPEIEERIEVANVAERIPLDSNTVDLIVTSPPYGLDIGYSGGDILAATWPGFMQDWLAEAYRVAKQDGGRLALNVPLDVSEPSYRPVYSQAVWAAVSVGWEYRTTIVWDEGNSTKGNRGLGSVDSASAPHPVAQVEMIALFSKGSWRKSSAGRSDISHEEWQELGNGLWKFSGESHAWEGHPAAFPKELPRRLITYLSYVGDLVLDPFVGSGTTAVVAKQLKRLAVGFDLSEDYVNSTCRRIAAMGETTP